MNPSIIKLSLVNQSSVFADADLPALANALQIQISRDFYPVWGVNAKVYYTPAGKQPSKGHWVVALLDTADVSGALGYHDVTPDGLPLGKVFVKTTLADGGLASVTTSHEVLEMLVDPAINLSAEADDPRGGPPKFYSYESCDACERDADGYDIVIPAGWLGAGDTVRVSDFVFPAWFEAFRQTGPFDFLKKITRPFQLLSGGYISVLDLGNLSQGWQQIFAKGATAEVKLMARPQPGSRRSRRLLPRNEWIKSDYKPSAAKQVPAGVPGKV